MNRLFPTMGFYVVFACFTGPAMADGNQSGQYLLDAGDKISITVAREEELSMSVTLDSTGIFSFPYLGKIHALGKTAMQIEDLIRDGLDGDYLMNPHVEVKVNERRPFFINGEVNKQGAIPYQHGLTIRRALVLAGGLTDRADTNKIFVIRKNDPNRTSRKATMESRIFPGDTISVEPSYFFITGEVASTGKYPYHSRLTFRMAVTLAGGFSERADQDDVEVVRIIEGKSHELEVKLDDLVEPRDVITVNQSFF